MEKKEKMTQHMGLYRVQRAETLNDLNFIYTPGELLFNMDDSMQEAC